MSPTTATLPTTVVTHLSISDDARAWMKLLAFEVSQENRSPPSLPPSVMKLDQGDHDKITAMIILLTHEYTYSPQPNHRKVQLICLAAATVGFSSEAAQHLEVVVAIPSLDELLKDTPTHEFASVRLEWRKTKFYPSLYSELINLHIDPGMFLQRRVI
ncbi:hypothetical protein M8C21_020454 [Ambrosia artemisiifolia]|uniref:Uncharacterized protein n=1 Tax=Ambrosia artemisiifolia TaxID=4212 RepID=A0AAD5GEV1_AMBAR|nr:hypothetical protein M8C21_020454 [Ambrosia artemisiifolia]